MIYQKFTQVYLKRLTSFVNGNSVLANSLNLIMGSSVSAILGYFFWIIITRSHPTATVGLATALLSASSLISILGLVGYDVIFVRFLSRSEHKNDQINSGMIITAGATSLFATIFFMLIPLIVPKLEFIYGNVWYLVSFVIFTVFTNWNALTNAVLIAYRKTLFVLAINIIFSAIKLALPFIFHSGGPMTIFIIVGVAQIANVLLSIAAMMKYCEYIPGFKIRFDVVKKTIRFGTATYTANLLNLIPSSLLPLVIINRLGATSEAYFYMAFTIASLLYAVIYSTALATFAEASHNGTDFVRSIKKGTIIIMSLIVPAIICIIVLAPFILNFFGITYKFGATNILRVLSISGIPIMFYSLIGIMFKLTHNLKAVIVTAASNAISTMVLSLLFVSSFGLNGIGWAWLAGNCISVGVGLLFILRRFLVQRRLQSEEI